MYVVVTRYEPADPKKKPVVHAYSSTEREWTKNEATTVKSQIIRDHRHYNPNDKGTLTVSVLKLIDIDLLNRQFTQVTTNSHNPPLRGSRAYGSGVDKQTTHRGPSGEVLI